MELTEVVQQEISFGISDVILYKGFLLTLLSLTKVIYNIVLLIYFFIDLM